jgi:hypothetical protein
MTVTVDAVTESNRTDNTTPYTFSHSGGGGPEGVILILNLNGDEADLIDTATVSYGGTAMTLVAYEGNGVSTPSGGAVYMYFLGASVPTGTKTVSVDFTTANSRKVQCTCITLNGAADLEVVDSSAITSTSATNPQISLTYGGRTCMAFTGLLGSKSSVSDYTAVASTTDVFSEDFGARVGISQRQTTAGSSDFTVGWTASAAAYAMVACAVSEVANAVSIDFVGPANLEIIYDNELRVEIDGTNFSSSGNAVKIHDTDPLTTTPSVSVTQTIRTQSTTKITFDVDQGSLSSSNVWLEVENSGNTSNDSINIALRDDPGASAVAARANPVDTEFTAGQAFSFNFSEYFFASDVQDELSFSLSGQPSGVIVSTDGLVSGTIADGQSASSPFTCTMTCTDLDGNQVTDEFSWTVTAETSGGAEPKKQVSRFRRFLACPLLGRR